MAYEELREVLRTKLTRGTPNNVLYQGCLDAIEELIEENKRLEARIVGEIERLS